jgi:ABC-type nitrate/sulfonate/bicarbonate transport system substrate-binding protein
MAYVSNEKKSQIQAALKPIFQKYGIKATVGRNSYKSTLVVNVSAGDIDFGTDYQQVNVYWVNDHYTGKAKDFLNEVLDAIKKSGEWYDESNAQIDYFNTAFYIDINIGRWDKKYVYNNKVSLSNVLAFDALQQLGKLQIVYVR